MIVYDIYHDQIPDYVQDIMKTSIFQRLKDVGMNCGLEYTEFKMFEHCKGVSRYNHSIGVALITYHFTYDKHQTVAALLHDIATPVFAHVIDFMNHDHVKQESTEDLTEIMIREDKELNDIFKKYYIEVDKVINYHNYPIADNDSPRLSADRLEYTLSNAVYYGLKSKDEIRKIYNHLIVNEQKDEIVFDKQQSAFDFTELMLKCSQIYVADEDRYCMEYLARLIRYAIEQNILTYDDLYTTELQVIKKLKSHYETKQYFDEYQSFNTMLQSDEKKDGYMKVIGKKRYINPLVHGQRVLDLNKELKQKVQMYLDDDFNRYIKAIHKDKK